MNLVLVDLNGMDFFFFLFTLIFLSLVTEISQLLIIFTQSLVEKTDNSFFSEFPENEFLFTAADMHRTKV